MKYDCEQMDAWAAERRACVTPVKLTIETRVTSKWRFVDLETGAIWKWVPKLHGTENVSGFVRSSIPAVYACNYVEGDEIVDSLTYRPGR